MGEYKDPPIDNVSAVDKERTPPDDERIVDSLFTPMAELILDEKAVILNAAWGGEQLLGLPAKELVGLRLHRYSDGGSVNTFMSHLAKTLRSCTIQKCGMMLRNFATLRRIDVLVESVLICSQEDRTRIRTVLFNALGRKRLEDALLHSEQRLRALVRASSDVLYRMSADWSRMLQLSGGVFLPDTEVSSASWLAGVRTGIAEFHS